MSSTAYIVRDRKVQWQLKRDLVDESMVFRVGEARVGYRFDCIVLLCGLSSGDQDWWDQFRCSLKPNGEVLQG